MTSMALSPARRPPPRRRRSHQCERSAKRNTRASEQRWRVAQDGNTGARAQRARRWATITVVGGERRWRVAWDASIPHAVASRVARRAGGAAQELARATSSGALEAYSRIEAHARTTSKTSTRATRGRGRGSRERRGRRSSSRSRCARGSGGGRQETSASEREEREERGGCSSGSSRGTQRANRRRSLRWALVEASNAHRPRGPAADFVVFVLLARFRSCAPYPAIPSSLLSLSLRGCVRCERASTLLAPSLSRALPVRMSAPRTCRATS